MFGRQLPRCRDCASLLLSRPLEVVKLGRDNPVRCSAAGMWPCHCPRRDLAQHGDPAARRLEAGALDDGTLRGFLVVHLREGPCAPAVTVSQPRATALGKLM
jgi:hypothetical protein